MEKHNHQVVFGRKEPVGEAAIKKSDAYQVITDRIIQLLEKGVIPWNRPWTSSTHGGRAINLVSKRPYRGINAMLLPAMGYQSPYWLSFKQCQQLGGQVRKGEKSTPVVFWKWLLVEDKDKDGNITTEKIPMLRYYNVFNVEQCDGLLGKVPVEKPSSRPEFNIIEACEAIIAGYESKPDIRHGGNSAYYSPRLDYIGMPSKDSFSKPEEYYSTLFHEAVHSTGHNSRLNRFTGEAANTMFGSQSYSQEELIAEMGASYLNGEAGIVDTVINNSAAYIQSWLKRLKNDRKLVILAAARAQKASEYILGQECHRRDI